MINKMLHAYYMRQARKGQKIETIIKRHDVKEIINLFENISAEKRRDAAYLLISEELEPSVETKISDLLNELTLKYGSDKELLERVKKRPNSFRLRDFKMFHRDSDKIIMTFVTLCDDISCDFEDLFLRGKEEELKVYFLKLVCSIIGPEEALWALASQDSEVQKKLRSKDIVFGTQAIEKIFASKNKKYIMFLFKEKKINSFWIKQILSEESGISLTKEERTSIEEQLPVFEHRDKVLAEIAMHFDCVR